MGGCRAWVRTLFGQMMSPTHVLLDPDTRWHARHFCCVNGGEKALGWGLGVGGEQRKREDLGPLLTWLPRLG